MDLLEQYGKQIVNWDEAKEYIWYPNRIMTTGVIENLNDEKRLLLYKKDEITICMKSLDGSLEDNFEDLEDEVSAILTTITLTDPETKGSYSVTGMMIRGQGYLVMKNPKFQDTMIISSLDTFSNLSGRTYITNDGLTFTTSTGPSMAMDASGYVTIIHNDEPVMTTGTISADTIRSGYITTGLNTAATANRYSPETLPGVSGVGWSIPMDSQIESTVRMMQREIESVVSPYIGADLVIGNGARYAPGTITIDTSSMSQEQLDRLAADLVEYSAPLIPTPIPISDETRVVASIPDDTEENI